MRFFRRRASRASLMTTIASLRDERDKTIQVYGGYLALYYEGARQLAALVAERDASRKVATELEEKLLAERAGRDAETGRLGELLVRERATVQSTFATLDGVREDLGRAYQSRNFLALALADINAALDGANDVVQKSANASRSSIDNTALIAIRAALGTVEAHLDEPLDEPEPEPAPAVWVPQPGEIVTVVVDYRGRPTDRDGQLAEYVEARENTEYPHRVRWVINPAGNGCGDEDSDIVHQVAQYTAPEVAPGPLRTPVQKDGSFECLGDSDCTNCEECNHCLQCLHYTAGCVHGCGPVSDGICTCEVTA